MAQPARITITPKDQERHRTDTKKVRVYFIGYEYAQTFQGDPPAVYVKGRAFKLPELGESIILDEVIANDLIFKTKWDGKVTMLSEHEGGAEVASLLINALQEGVDFADLDFERIKAKRIAEQSLSDEDLLKLIEDRDMTIPPELVKKVKDKEKVK